MKNPDEWPASEPVMRKVADLVPYARNPRTHSERQVDKIAASMREWGWTNPCLIDEEDMLIAGHGRILAAQKLALEQAPCIVARGWSEAQKRAYVIADNQLAIDAGWDMDLLAAEFEELKALDYDLELTGFDGAEIRDVLVSAIDPVVDPGPGDPPEDAVSKAGDLWVMGGHRLLCGDSTDLACVERVMAGEKAALCATDPPYAVDYDRGRIGQEESSKARPLDHYHEVADEDFEPFLRAFLGRVLSVLAVRGALYVWHSPKRYPLLQRVFADLGLLDHQQIVWVKPSGAGRSHLVWIPRFEICLFGWRKGSKPESLNHEHDSVWEVAGENDGRNHPTQKPLELFARPMRKHTKPGDVVFEPFSGSGSQLIAAEAESRACRAIELSPAYVDVAVHRWQGATNKAATLDGDGRTFAEIAEERGHVEAAVSAD